MMCDDKLGRSVHMLSRLLKRNTDMEVIKYGITGVQSVIIGFIYEKARKKDVFAKDIEKAFDLRRASSAGIIQNMEKNGLIKREMVGNDARLRKIVLTEKALELRRKLDKSIKNIEKKMQEGLTKEEVEKYIELTEKMSKNLEKRRG